MIEIVPFMLFILSWNPDAPDRTQLERVKVVFEQQEDCEQLGSEMVRSLTENEAADSNRRFEYRCMEVPTSDEFRRGRRAPSEGRP